jgi:hypothetical protein
VVGAPRPRYPDGRYHRDIALPNVPLPRGTFRLRYTRHARKAACTDRYGQIRLPHNLDTERCELVIVELRDGRVAQLVYRTRHDAEYDLVLVVALPGWKVVTVWLNHFLDHHATLDRSRYVQLEEWTCTTA